MLGDVRHPSPVTHHPCRGAPLAPDTISEAASSPAPAERDGEQSVRLRTESPLTATSNPPALPGGPPGRTLAEVGSSTGFRCVTVAILGAGKVQTAFLGGSVHMDSGCCSRPTHLRENPTRGPTRGEMGSWAVGRVWPCSVHPAPGLNFSHGKSKYKYNASNGVWQ